MARYALERIGGGSCRGGSARAAQARRRLESRSDRIAGRPPRRGKASPCWPGCSAMPTRPSPAPPRRRWAHPDRRGVPSTVEGQAVERAGQAGRHRQLAGLRGGLLAADKPAEAQAIYEAYTGARPAEARSPGGHARHVGLRRKETVASPAGGGCCEKRPVAVSRARLVGCDTCSRRPFAGGRRGGRRSANGDRPSRRYR